MGSSHPIGMSAPVLPGLERLMETCRARSLSGSVKRWRCLNVPIIMKRIFPSFWGAYSAPAAPSAGRGATNMYRTTLLLLTCLFLLGGDAPSLGPQPARYKWVVGTVKTLTTQLTTTIYYGPWQCRQDVFLDCQKKCGAQSKFRGCIWIADIKFDGQTNIPFMGTILKGDRYALAHCCCDYPTVKDIQSVRDEWNAFKPAFRREWINRFGGWEKEAGEFWPGHHVHDILHGGAPVDPANILPTPPGVHKVFNKEYPACYDGLSPWNTHGADLPYYAD